MTNENRDTRRHNESEEMPKKSEPEDVEVVDQDPGERQKENQNDSKDDPLAA